MTPAVWVWPGTLMKKQKKKKKGQIAPNISSHPGTYQHHLVQLGGLGHVTLAEDDDGARGVDAASPRSPCHLDVLARQQVAHARPVMLPHAVKHHRACWHVHPHRKRFCCKQNLGAEKERV